MGSSRKSIQSCKASQKGQCVWLVTHKEKVNINILYMEDLLELLLQKKMHLIHGE